MRKRCVWQRVVFTPGTISSSLPRCPDVQDASTQKQENSPQMWSHSLEGGRLCPHPLRPNYLWPKQSLQASATQPQQCSCGRRAAVIPSFQSSNPHTQIIKVFSYSSLSITNFSKVAVIPRRGGNTKEGQNLAKEPELSYKFCR